MQSRREQSIRIEQEFNLPTCDCCQYIEQHERRVARRDFLKTAGGVVLGAGALGGVLPAGRVWAQAKSADATAAAAGSSPESLVKVLFDALSPKQREAICFPWDHQ